MAKKRIKIKPISSLRIKQVKDTIGIYEEKLKQAFSTESVKDIRDIIVSIVAYAFFGFLGIFFVLNVLKGNVLGKWYEILMNFIGAGCGYYLLNDFLQFFIREIKRK